MNVVVLGGGDSPERDVSLRSALAVSAALRQAGYQVLELDPKDEDFISHIPKGSIVFPILHGKNGEDGVVQAMLEAANLPYLGSGVEVSRACFDKAKTRQAFADAHLPIARGDSVTETSYVTHPLALGPHVLKVNQGGSSIGTLLVRDPSAVSAQQIKEIFMLGKEAVIEELVEGVEITVPIIDGKALPVIEIQPPQNEEFDYLNKYNGKSKELCPPISINDAIQKQAQAYAEQAHQALGCRHLSRVDIIVRPDSSMVLLEINTLPGMTGQSLYPIGARAAGYSFPDLVDLFVQFVQRDNTLA